MKQLLKDAIEVNDEPNYPRINSRRTAYIGLIRNWDEDAISNIKQVKTLALNKNNDVICEISFPYKGKTVIPNIIKALEVAKRKNAVKVIIGENQPDKRVNPSPEEKDMAKNLWAVAKEHNMPMQDLMVVSENSFYSFAENGLK